MKGKTPRLEGGRRRTVSGRCARRSTDEPQPSIRAMVVHAHYDDFEFTTAGTFAQWRRGLGDRFLGRVLICTDGAAGHHRLSRTETAKRRLTEQRESARLGGYEFRLLRLRGKRVPREGCLEPNRWVLAALWKAIRDFEPDYLFCPPLPDDPRLGVHVDHLVVAESVRRVAYLLNVPHAYTPEYPSRERPPRPRKVPVILQTSDSYMVGVRSWDLAVDIDGVFDEVALMSWQHQSQIREWLPWVGRHAMEPPRSFGHWKRMLRERFRRRQHQWGVVHSGFVEVFGVTAWGEVPTADQLRSDFPKLVDPRALDRLVRRLRRWRC